MELYIYDKDLNLSGVCDNFSSLNWTRRFFSAGGFSLTAPSSDENMRILKKHSLIAKAKDDEAGLITGLTVEHNQKGEFINATGILISGVLDNRILLTPDNDFLTLLDKNIGMAAAANRRIPKLYVNPNLSLPSDYHEELLYSNLGKYCEAVCRKNGVGLNVALERNGAGNRLRLNAVKGVDRSREQRVNPMVVFSNDFDNLRGVKYQYSENGATSMVYGYATIPAGAEYTGAPLVRTFGDENIGYDRIETSKSVRANTYNSYMEVFMGYDANDNPIYKERLVIRVHAANTNTAIDNVIADSTKSPAENFTGAVLFEGGYKIDYDLGDIVTIFHKKWDMSTSNRICEVTENYQKGGVTVTPVFGSALPTVSDILSKK